MGEQELLTLQAQLPACPACFEGLQEWGGCRRRSRPSGVDNLPLSGAFEVDCLLRRNGRPPQEEGKELTRVGLKGQRVKRRPVQQAVAKSISATMACLHPGSLTGQVF